MHNDLNEQFQRAQAAEMDDGPRKWIVALIAGAFLVFGLIIVAGTIFFVKTLDKFFEENPDSGSSYSSEYDADSNFSDRVSDRDYGSSNFVTSNFEYGTVNGNSYYSEFSGISFKAPADWVVTGYSDSSYSNLLSPRDLSASDDDMSTSVVITYQAMKSHLYTKAEDALEKHIDTATTVENNSLVNSDVTASFGGNQFVGIIYKKTMSDTYSYFTEVLVSEVNGYILEIYIQADTEADLKSTLAMFK